MALMSSMILFVALIGGAGIITVCAFLQVQSFDLQRSIGAVIVLGSVGAIFASLVPLLTNVRGMDLELTERSVKGPIGSSRNTRLFPTRAEIALNEIDWDNLPDDDQFSALRSFLRLRIIPKPMPQIKTRDGRAIVLDFYLHSPAQLKEFMRLLRSMRRAI